MGKARASGYAPAHLAAASSHARSGDFARRCRAARGVRTAIVSEGSPMTAYDGRTIRLRASYSAEYEEATLVNELGHRLALGFGRSGLDDHRLPYLPLRRLDRPLRQGLRRPHGRDRTPHPSPLRLRRRLDLGVDDDAGRKTGAIARVAGDAGVNLLSSTVLSVPHPQLPRKETKGGSKPRSSLRSRDHPRLDEVRSPQT
jgi:hypothetical protein